MRTIADEMFEEAQITPHIVLETENIQTVLALAEKGMGITFYPRMFISGQAEVQELKSGQGPLNFYSWTIQRPTAFWRSVTTKAIICHRPPKNSYKPQKKPYRRYPTYQV